MAINRKRPGKRELRDYLQEQHAALRQRQTEIAGELTTLEGLMETVDKIVEIKK